MTTIQNNKSLSKNTAVMKGKRAAAAKPPVGMIGLGIMGSAMAGNLLQAGFPVHGYDTDATQAESLVKAGGISHASLADIAQECEYFVLSLPTAGALDAVANELSAAARAGSVVAEVSTLESEAKERARAALAHAGIILLDCPLSGTGAQAKQRDLAVYASGDANAIKRFAPIFDGFARVRYDVGSFGNGMKMKLAANLLVAIHNVAAAEALLLGACMGLDAATMIQVLGDGAGSSRMLQVRGPLMADRSWDAPTMKVQVWQKDMRLISELLQQFSVPAPLFNATVPVYQAAMDLGHGQHDTAAVYGVLERWATPVST